MKATSIIVVLASLTALASSAPNPAPQSSPVHYLESRDSINDCFDSSFTNQSSEGSPLVEDCLQITRNIAGGGSWAVALVRQYQIASFGTCAFGVQAKFDFLSTNIRVGNQDIIDVINESVKRFQWNGLVGAKGNMPCTSDFGYGSTNIDTEWGIYHT